MNIFRHLSTVALLAWRCAVMVAAQPTVRRKAEIKGVALERNGFVKIVAEHFSVQEKPTSGSDISSTRIWQRGQMAARRT
jgi:hypothetical protein